MNLNDSSMYSNHSNCPFNSDFLSLQQRLKITNTVIWSMIAIIGILANGSVLALMFLTSKFTSATQYFIVNLALSDLIFLAVCPTFLIINNQTSIYKYMPLILSNLVCKLDYFLTHLTVFITCLTLMSMTFDRYQVIMYPLRAIAGRTTTKAVLTNVFIWIFSTILCLPFAYYRIVEEFSSDSVECVNSEQLENEIFRELNMDQILLIYKITISYVIPLSTIIVCYVFMFSKLNNRSKLLRQEAIDQQKRRRVLIMIGVVSILFALCWGPIHIFHVYLKFNEKFDFCSIWLFIFKSMAHTLTFMNSMLNPFFYTIFGNNFRRQVILQKQKYSSKLRTIKYNNSILNVNPNLRKESFELMNQTNRAGSVCNGGIKRLSFFSDQ